MIQIKHRYTEAVLFEAETETVKEAVAAANLSGANLRWTDLSDADLQDADLRGADLRWTNLDGVKAAWQSHDLIAEILRREAGGAIDKEAFAGLVLIKREWCWNDHLKAKHPQLEWALRTLAKWIQPGDGHPECLDAYAAADA